MSSVNFLRKSVLLGAASFLSFVLFSLAAVVGILQVVGSPEHVKKTLSDSGVYNSVISSALENAQKSTVEGTEVSLTDPAIKKAAEATFTPQTIEDSTEKVIDGVYDWLNGETPQPNFNIDLTNVKTTFAQQVGKAAAERASTLPACTGVPTDTDPFKATCLPRGVSAAQIGQQAEQNVIRGEGFLEKPVITADNFKNESNTQNVFDNQLKDVPANYQRLKVTPIILSVLALLIIAAIIFFSATKRKGFRKVGIILLTVGVFMLIFAWALNYYVNQKLVQDIKLDNKVLQTNAQKLAKSVGEDVDKNYWIFGGAYTALGVLTIAGTMFLGRGPGKPSKPSSPEKDNDEPEPHEETSKTAYKAPQKPPKRTVIVQ